MHGTVGGGEEEVKFGLCLGPLSYLHDEGLDGASGAIS